MYIYIYGYICNIYNITELKNNGVKLCGNPQFARAITNCVLIQKMFNKIVLIHGME